MGLRRHSADKPRPAFITWGVVLASLIMASAAGAATGAPAAAADPHAYRHGVVAPLGSTATPLAAAPLAGAPAAAGPQALVRASNLVYQGGVGGIGVTTGTPRVYLVFWGSQWGTASTGSGRTTLTGDPKGMAPYLQAFFAGVGTGSELWSGVMTQYCEGVSSGSTSCPAAAAHVGYPGGAGALAGVWADTSAPTPSAATGHQLAVEAVNAAAHFGVTGAAANRNVQYVIVSPTATKPDGFNTAGGQFCAWHDYSGDSTLAGGGGVAGATPVAFTNLPYVTDLGSSCGQNFVNGGAAGSLDGVSIVGGHEYAETITDQFPSGGWIDSRGMENGDKCAWIRTGAQAASQDITLTTGTFAVQSTWANDASGCEVSHPIVTSTAPSDFSVAASPASVSVVTGQSTSAAISTAVTSGAAGSVGLSVTGVPAGASASLSPTSVTAGGSSTLSIATGSAATGSYSLTVTGTGAGKTHSTAVGLTISPAATNGFSIAAGPASLTVAQGASSTSTISTAVTSGSAQSVALSVAGAPAGSVATLSPTSVTAGGSSTLTVSAGTATAGSYTVTVTGTAGGASHQATVALTVTAASGGGGGGGAVVVNGDFETGAFSPWTTAGAAEAIVAPGHASNHAARLGSASPTNGDSTMQQTVRVPAASGTLSFWYQPHCPDTLVYDQQQMEIRSTTGAVLKTELNVCDKSGVWKQFTASLATWAGLNVVLWFNSHDDDYIGDPTYLLIDDVAVTGTGARPRSPAHTRPAPWRP